MASLPIDHDTKPVSKTDPVRTIEGWLRGESKARPVVMDGKVPYGLPDARSLMSHKYDAGSKLEKHTRPVPTLSVSDAPDDALLKMSEAYVDYLPVRSDDHDKLAGVVDALELMTRFDEGPDAASAALWVEPLRATQDMGDALRRFANETNDQLPVVDGSGTIVGVLHRHAVLGHIQAARQRSGRQDLSGEKTALKDNAVEGYMEPGWNTVPTDEPFVALRDSLDKQRYTFVADGGRVRDGKVGLVTPAVLVRSLFRTVLRPTSWSPTEPGIPRPSHAPDYGRET